MKATGIVRRIDDLRRIVILKEIRRTLRIREGDLSQTTLTPIDRFCWAIHSLAENVPPSAKRIAVVGSKPRGGTFLLLLYQPQKKKSNHTNKFESINLPLLQIIAS